VFHQSYLVTVIVAMRLALSMLTVLWGATSAAAQGDPLGKQDKDLRRTQSEECILRVVKQEKEYVFECEMDPSDVNGETGVTRGIDASPEQLASLRAMLDSGELAPGESVLVHGPGAEFDDENIFLLTDLSVTTSLRGRKLGIDNCFRIRKRFDCIRTSGCIWTDACEFNERPTPPKRTPAPTRRPTRRPVSSEDCFENRTQQGCNRNPSCFWNRSDRVCEPTTPPPRTPPPTRRPTRRPVSSDDCFGQTQYGCNRIRGCFWNRYDGVCQSIRL